ncbi:MAG: asparagine synthase [Proteobacteria bacterium]|nr:asparagine synthase [Pseudomonadota bacterium]
MPVELNERYEWRTKERGPILVHHRGDDAAVDSIVKALLAVECPGVDDAVAALRAADGHFAAIIEGPDFLLACVDHCRSIPVFFAEAQGNGPVVSNDARMVKKAADLGRVSEVSALEAAMAGFVTGRHTLFDGLSQLQAGDLMWHDRRSGRTALRQYFVYWPDALNEADEGRLIEQLAGAIDRAMRRVIAQAGGAPIWVPLSAGLDSRLVLCKLVEQGYDNLAAFSYGPAGNDEARAARTVARRLGVPWRFYPNRNRDMRRLFASPARADYWAYGDGLCTLPNLQDFPTLYRLDERHGLPDGVVVVNGQTGDFISGGHIPETLSASESPTLDDLFDAIVVKHYSLWQSLKTPGNLSRLRARVWEDLELHGDERPSRDEIIALYERWEYQERQAKHIINGQRNYDFLGVGWALPLWDRSFVEFWRNVPPEYKFGQRLYRRYLESWDFRGLFKGFEPVVWQWPGAMKAVLPLFRLIRLTLGPGTRDRVLKSLLYFGMHRHQYAPFGYRYFLRHAQNLRNPVSVLSRRWLAELGISVSAG